MLQSPSPRNAEITSCRQVRMLQFRCGATGERFVCFMSVIETPGSLPTEPAVGAEATHKSRQEKTQFERWQYRSLMRMILYSTYGVCAPRLRV